MEQFGYLHIIDENHVDMQQMYEKIREIVSANQLGPRIYLYPIYTYYSSLLSDKIKLMTERIFEQDTIPKLPVTIKAYNLKAGQKSNNQLNKCMETNQICTENCHLQFPILSIDCLFFFTLQFIQ